MFVPFAQVTKSLNITDMAMLSRAVCGISNATLIINLPGSPKGAVECYGFVRGCIPHAVQLLTGKTKQIKETHEKMQGCHHHHHHPHHHHEHSKVSSCILFLKD